MYCSLPGSVCGAGCGRRLCRTRTSTRLRQHSRARFCSRLGLDAPPAPPFLPPVTHGAGRTAQHSSAARQTSRGRSKRSKLSSRGRPWGRRECAQLRLEARGADTCHQRPNSLPSWSCSMLPSIPPSSYLPTWQADTRQGRRGAGSRASCADTCLAVPQQPHRVPLSGRGLASHRPARGAAHRSGGARTRRGKGNGERGRDMCECW